MVADNKYINYVWLLTWYCLIKSTSLNIPVTWYMDIVDYIPIMYPLLHIIIYPLHIPLSLVFIQVPMFAPRHNLKDLALECAPGTIGSSYLQDGAP